MPGGEGARTLTSPPAVGWGPGQRGSWGKQLVPAHGPGEHLAGPSHLWLCPPQPLAGSNPRGRRACGGTAHVPCTAVQRGCEVWRLAEAPCPCYRPGKEATLTTTKAPSAKPLPAPLTAASSRPGHHQPSAGGGVGVGAHRPARSAAPEPHRGPSEPQVHPPRPGTPGALEGPLRTGRGLLELPLGSWGEGAVS